MILRYMRKAASAVRLLMQDPEEFCQVLNEKKFNLFPMRRVEYNKKFKMSLVKWLIWHQKAIHFKKCHWMGVKAYKNPFDSWIYQEIIYEVQPDVIIEIGSAEGGSTLYFAHLLDLLGKGIVISVDIDRSCYNVKHDRIHVITGDSSSLETISTVAKLCKGRTVLLIHDGNHSKEAVLKDLKAYSSFISVGSYFIVEDGIVDLFSKGGCFGSFDEGPLAAVEEFLCTTSDFVVDKEKERYILTYNPKGFLRRIKEDIGSNEVWI